MTYHVKEIGINNMEKIASLYSKKLGEEFLMEVFGVEGAIKAKFTGFGLFVYFDNHWMNNETIFAHLLTGQAVIREV